MSENAKLPDFEGLSPKEIMLAIEMLILNQGREGEPSARRLMEKDFAAMSAARE